MLVDIIYWIILAIIVFFIIQCVRLIFADADLTLLWKLKFGKKPTCLAGQVVWITGASSGIGEYLVYELARAGCRLILSARRKEELERVKKQCLLSAKVREDDVYILPLDMMKVDSHKTAVNEVIQQFQKIDILVNNAGQSQRAFLKDTQLEVDQKIMTLNYLSVISLTKAVLPHMLKAKKGHIVVTSSVAGKLGAVKSAAYSASKYAIHGWFDTARVELISNNIDITLVCPGPVESSVLTNAYAGTIEKTYSSDKDIREKRMTTERCAELMAFAIANRIDEVWISLQPILLITYICQYMPDTSRVLFKMSRKRMSTFKSLRDGAAPSFRK